MAANTYTQHYADGTQERRRRSTKQGRRPSGLGDPYVQRLDAETEQVLTEIGARLGPLYNKNEIVRNAVRMFVNSIYTDLVNP
jgi:hypothetical protein